MFCTFSLDERICLNQTFNKQRMLLFLIINCIGNTGFSLYLLHVNISFNQLILYLFLTGCQLLFTDETANQRLTFFPTDSVREKDVNVPANHTCSFFYGSQFYVQYLDCTGSWRSISQQSVLNTIELTPGWSTKHLRIRVSFHD